MKSLFTARYAHSLIVLHWLTVVLLVAVYACIELRVLFPRGSDGRELIKYWHFVLGMSVFALTWVRLALRLRNRTPPITPPLSPLQTGIAGLAVLLLYLLMLAVPLSGYLMLNAAGKPLLLFGMQLPTFIAADKALASRIKELHETIATAGYFLIGLHALAGLYHHYLRRDDTLRRMLTRG